MRNNNEFVSKFIFFPETMESVTCKREYMKNSKTMKEDIKNISINLFIFYYI